MRVFTVGPNRKEFGYETIPRLRNHRRLRAPVCNLNPDLLFDMNTKTFIDDTMRDMNRRRLEDAAPDLLQACKDAMDLICLAKQYFPKSVRHSDTFHLLNIEANSIRKAIDKAEGIQ